MPLKLGDQSMDKVSEHILYLPPTRSHRLKGLDHQWPKVDMADTQFLVLNDDIRECVIVFEFLRDKRADLTYAMLSENSSRAEVISTLNGFSDFKILLSLIFRV